MRSRAAAALLAGEGFEPVFTMDGGFRAWQGLVAEGPPEAGMAYFPVSAGPEELIALAWALEEGSGKFYAHLASVLDDAEAVSLFHRLTEAEQHHQASLRALYRDLQGMEPGPDFPARSLPGEISGDVMEGGMSLSEAIEWGKGRDLPQILELALSLETNSYDLYLKMRRRMTDPRSKKIFTALSDEEKQHLVQLSALLDKKL